MFEDIAQRLCHFFLPSKFGDSCQREEGFSHPALRGCSSRVPEKQVHASGNHYLLSPHLILVISYTPASHALEHRYCHYPHFTDADEEAPSQDENPNLSDSTVPTLPTVPCCGEGRASLSEGIGGEEGAKESAADSCSLGEQGETHFAILMSR